MRISRPVKILLGIFTTSQLFVGLWLLVWFLTGLMPVIASGNEAAFQDFFMISLSEIIIWGISVFMISMLLLVFYIVHAATNKQLSTTMKVIWILLIIFFGSIVEVVYFFMEIVPERSMTARLEKTNVLSSQG